MRKIIFIPVLLFAFVLDTDAQKKIIYQDTGLLQKEEQTVAPVENYSITDTAVADEAPASEMEDEEPADTTLQINGLQLDYDSVKNWRHLKSYAYTKYLDSLLKAKQQQKPRQTSLPRKSFLSGLFNSGIVNIFLWTLAIVFVLFIIYRLFLADGAFRRKTKQADHIDARVEEEIITPESDFDMLIRQALHSGNYRQAVRYQYLRTLHLLAGKNLLQLSPDKTNFQYVNEITNRAYYQDFAAITLKYEYVWYGGFDIDKNIYHRIENDFTGFNKKI
jgi:hypothetical protein